MDDATASAPATAPASAPPASPPAPDPPGPLIRALPEFLRPRERLRLLGAESLLDRELLALVLGCGHRRRSVLELADDLLRRCGRLESLADLGLAELARFRGLGEAGACRVTALVEVARRMGCGGARGGLVLSDAGAVFELLRPRLIGERRERVMVLLVDARRRLLGERCVSIGSLMSSVIHPREVFRPAIGLSAAGLILVHNHPSGDPTPSVEDHQVTLRLAEAGTLLGIRLLDHVVIAADGFRSFRDEGWLPERW
jgi:DNA repair protein RadC